MKLIWSTCTRVFNNKTLDSIHWIEPQRAYQPRSGDVVLAKVIKAGNKPLNRIEDVNDHVQILKVDDYLVGVMGSRTVLSYLSGEPPSTGDDIHIHTLSVGGIVGKLKDLTIEAPEPPQLKLLSYATINKDNILNTIDYCLNPIINTEISRPPTAIIIIGDGRSSGKTTVSSRIIESFTSIGRNVCGVKLTGVARKRDSLQYEEAGAIYTTDFIDAGLPSTIIDPKILEKSTRYLVKNASTKSDFLVCELGAGLFSDYNVENTIRLLLRICKVCSIIVCCRTRASVYGCASMLNELLLKNDSKSTPCFISGPITNGKTGEMAVKMLTNHPVFSIMHGSEVTNEGIIKFIKENSNLETLLSEG